MIKTAEAVSPAHPDKLADQISDLILTEALKQDPLSRVAVEVLGGHGNIHVVGEMTTDAHLDVSALVKRVLLDNRYEDFDYYGISTRIVKQSQNIAHGVDIGGAGDQGIVVGYACRENDAMIPQELYLARKILRELWWRNPQCRDAKSQVTIEDNRVTKVVVSAERLGRKYILPAITAALGVEGMESLSPDGDSILTNPAGDWRNGGFDADTGLTGRKIACDNYGPQIEIGGGCFSGKDPSKVDRSGAYMARHLAVRLLLGCDADWVKVKAAYAIGVARPVMVSIEYSDMQHIQDKTKMFANEFTPEAMINVLRLYEQDYYQVAKWGSFGNGFTWDQKTI